MNSNESNAFINNNIDLESNPYITEKSYSNNIRKIRINTMKANLIAVFILLGVQIVFIFVGIFAFEQKALQILFCIINLPILLIISFSPGGTVCQYDYSSKTFTSYLLPTVPIPIPYKCFSLTINFEKIDGFYLQNVTGGTKKYYKIGVKDISEQYRIIAIGQDSGCQGELDEKIKMIPFILRTYLKPAGPTMS